MAYRIAVMPGDGIGPEVVAAAELVLAEVVKGDHLDVDLVRFPHGADHYLQTGELLGDGALADLLGCDALLFGAAGDPRLPTGTMERALIVELGRRAGLTVGVRPVALASDRLSPLKTPGRLDMVIVRDIAEGELALPGGTTRSGTAHEATASVVLHTRAGVDETLRYGFGLAGERRNKVTVVAQANALGAHRIWHERAQALAGEFPDVELELSYPDAAAMDLIRRPEEFDVVVSTILLGGILTDLAAALVGGMGLIASSRLNLETGFGVFEPAHGSAPKHAGRNRVCPLATISALAMLLNQIGEKVAGSRVEHAVNSALRAGDIADVSSASPLGTEGAAEVVIRHLA